MFLRKSGLQRIQYQMFLKPEIQNKQCYNFLRNRKFIVIIRDVASFTFWSLNKHILKNFASSRFRLQFDSSRLWYVVVCGVMFILCGWMWKWCNSKCCRHSKVFSNTIATQKLSMHSAETDFSNAWKVFTAPAS